MSDGILQDKRFSFISKLGFDVDEINCQLSQWDDGIVDSACDELFKDIYSENLEFIKDRGYDDEFVLYLFFLHSDSFSVSADVFAARLKAVEEQLGYDSKGKLKRDLFANGQSEIFELIGWLTADHSQWLAEMQKLAEKI